MLTFINFPYICNTHINIPRISATPNRQSILRHGKATGGMDAGIGRYVNRLRRTKRMIMKNAFILAITAIAVAACGEKAPGTILPADVTLETGDIVFRMGGGLSSHAVRFADKGGRYSHVGIVVDSAGTKMIVHAVPDEPDFEGDPDRVKMETPEKFYSSINANCGEVKRLENDAATAERAAAFALETYRRGTLFDHDYDDSDTTKMYCCELVETAYRKAGTPLAEGARHDIKLPGMRRIRCILPSDICNNGKLKRIIAF